MTRLLGLVVLAMTIAGVTKDTHAAFITYEANLTGPDESPPNTSPGTGFAQVDFDIVSHTLHGHVPFTALPATTTASPIPAATAVPGTGTAIIATELPSFVSFPLGVTSGTYDQIFD